MESVSERIKKIEKFLEEQKEEDEEEPVKSTFEGEYKSQTGLFRGKTKGTVELPVGEAAMIPLLKNIVKNQELERKRWERSNPIKGDEPIYDWTEGTIDGVPLPQTITFYLNVPEGYVFYFEYFNVTYKTFSTYWIEIDGVYQPELTDVLQDFGDHRQIYKPPKVCYNRAEVKILNMGANPQTYSCFFRGFLRPVKVHQELMEEL